MKDSKLRTFAQLERQMKASRQLRAETLARGFARTIEGLSSVRRILLRITAYSPRRV